MPENRSKEEINRLKQKYPEIIKRIEEWRKNPNDETLSEILYRIELIEEKAKLWLY